MVAVLTASTLLSGCELGSQSIDETQSHESSPLSAEVRQALRARVRAVRAGNEAAFLAGLSDDAVLRREQRDYFANLQDLPIEKFGYRLDEGSVETLPGHAGAPAQVQAEVDVILQLAGFDSEPVRTPDRITFVRQDDGTLLIEEPSDRDYLADQGGQLQPWDLGRVLIVEGDQALGIFDQPSSEQAAQIVDDVENAADDVRPELPLAWNSGVVVYGLSDDAFLSGLRDLPGGVADRLDGVTFPVTATPGGGDYAGIRFLLHPRMVARPDEARRRLIRHELVHVALGQLDDQVPVWLSEGIAEYVSVRPIAEHQRLISRDAITAAQRGLSALPADYTFNGADSAANYGIAWFACEYIAATYGEPTLWRLFDQMRAGRGTASGDQDAVLQEVLGIDERRLAAATGSRITTVFG